MTATKKVLAVVLCLSLLLGFVAFATETAPEDATVEISLNKTEVSAGEAELALTVEIDNLAENLSVARVVIAIDSEKIAVKDVAPVAQTSYNYQIDITNETPSSEKVTYDILLTVAEEVTEEETVNIRLVSATLLNDADPQAEITNTLGEAKTVTLTVPEEPENPENPENPEVPVVTSKLTFDYAITSADNFKVTYEKVTDEEPAHKVETTLVVSVDGKSIEITPDSAFEQGAYKVKVEADGYFIPAIDNFIITGEVTAPEFTAKLKAGKITDDSKVDILDFHTLCKAIEERETDNVKYDLNRDGVVDKKDVEILVENWEASF